MSIYFDNAAAMVPDGEVVEFYKNSISKYFANQEASHRWGNEAQKAMDRAAEELTTSVANRTMGVVWADSGTTLFNMVSKLKYLSTGNIVVSPLEHPALLANLRRSGLEVRLLPCNRDGIDWQKGRALLDNNTRLVAIFHVQSELGLINDISVATEHIREKAPNALFLCDTIQSATKLALPTEPDIMTISGHKIGALGGSALLFNKSKLKISEFEAMRHVDYSIGRVEVSQALTLNFAAQLRKTRQVIELENVSKINHFLRKNLHATIKKSQASDYILHILLKGYQSAIVMRMLSDRNIMVSSSSACASESKNPSAALLSLGYNREESYSGLRLSFSPQSTMGEAEEFTQMLNSSLNDY